MTESEDAFHQALNKKDEMTVRDLDLDAFADGVIAHRGRQGFHENPHGPAGTPTIERLSWAMGWNERALQKGDP
jgi:hypothetical protein